MHSGHYNAIRQAKRLCDVLVVGVHSDNEIEANKALPVMNQEERYSLLDHVRWIDEIVYDVPYSPSLETLKQARAEICIHGDDIPVNSDGVGAYDMMKQAGCLRIIKRTEGVSTTDLVGRLLTMTKVREEGDSQNLTGKASEVDSSVDVECHGPGFLATTRRIAEFSSRRVPSDDDKIVYVGGDFDMFNVSHALFLQRCKAQGTFLLVGVWGDEAMRNLKGESNPVMGVHERVLNVSACKHVDEVLISAPTTVSKDLITTMQISVVCEGLDPALKGPPKSLTVPRELGILHEVEVPKKIVTVDDIARRIAEQRLLYTKRNEVRAQRERAYYEAADNQRPAEI
jgi:ethanolamine-phosphate cytidylyltransferase